MNSALNSCLKYPYWGDFDLGVVSCKLFLPKCILVRMFDPSNRTKAEHLVRKSISIQEPVVIFYVTLFVHIHIFVGIPCTFQMTVYFCHMYVAEIIHIRHRTTNTCFTTMKTYTKEEGNSPL